MTIFKHPAYPAPQTPTILILVLSSTTMHPALPETIIRIAIAAHEHALLLGLKHLFESIPGCHVVLTAADGQQLLEELPAQQPVHIAIVHTHSPTTCGFQTIAHLREHFPETVPVALSRDDDDATILRARKAGASGHILTSYTMQQLSRAVDRLRATGRYLTDRAMQCILDNPDGLTPFERACAKERASVTDRHLQLIRTLFTWKEPTAGQAADALNISSRTVDTHLSRIYAAIGFRSKEALLLWAMYHKLLDPGAPPPPEDRKKQ